MSEELKFLSRQLRYERDEKDREIARLRAALRKIAGMNVDDDGYLMAAIATEALGDE